MKKVVIKDKEIIKKILQNKANCNEMTIYIMGEKESIYTNRKNKECYKKYIMPTRRIKFKNLVLFFRGGELRCYNLF